MFRKCFEMSGNNFFGCERLPPELEGGQKMLILPLQIFFYTIKEFLFIFFYHFNIIQNQWN